MDEIENKRWMITRIDNVIKIHEKFIEDHIEKFDNFTKVEIKRLEQMRNGGLTIIGFLISLVIGLASINIKPYPVESVISALLFIGVSMYFVFSIFSDKTSKILDIIALSLRHARDEMDFSLGYFTTVSLRAELLQISDYEKFHYYFTYFIVPSLRLESLYTLQKSKNSIMLSNSAREYLEDLYLENKTLIENAVEQYEKEKSNYESNNFLSELLKYGNLLLNYKKESSNKL